MAKKKPKKQKDFSVEKGGKVAIISGKTNKVVYEQG